MKLLTFLDEKVCPQILPTEKCPLEDAGMRVAAQDIHNLYDCPRYDESLRDGFAVCGIEPYVLMEHEAYAGNTVQTQLLAGQVCAIMTGGLVPLGADKVVPKEWANLIGPKVTLLAPLDAPSFIRKKGSQKEKGELLIKKGECLSVDHLALLANAGYSSVSVVQKPRVAILGTGSELKDVGVTLVTGQKTASNGLVLSHLVQDFGGTPNNCGVVADTREALIAFLHDIQHQEYNIIVATGGMGPGRYDLMEECFVEAGGEVITVTLPLLPGKSCLVGFLGRAIFYGFPGTPSALRPLFTELVAPTLLQMQGVVGDFPKSLEVTLVGDVYAREAEVPSLRGGQLLEKEGALVVRALGREEMNPSAYIIIPPKTSQLKSGDKVWVHSTGRSFFL